MALRFSSNTAPNIAGHASQPAGAKVALHLLYFPLALVYYHNSGTASVRLPARVAKKRLAAQPDTPISTHAQLGRSADSLAWNEENR